MSVTFFTMKGNMKRKVKDNRPEIITGLKNVEQLIGTGMFPGSAAQIVFVSTQFLSQLRTALEKQLENVKK